MSSKHYQPDFTAELDKLTQMFAEGGAGHNDALKNYKRLVEAIEHNEPDPRSRGPLLSIVQPSNVGLLGYLNPFSRAVWLRALGDSFESLNPKGPFFSVTLIPRNADYSTETSCHGFRMKTIKLRAQIEQLLDGLRASAFGNIEHAIFPKSKVSYGGYLMYPHAQFICWGCDEDKLKSAFKLAFPPLDTGVRGYWCPVITKTFHRALAYATKAPMYGYSEWPRGTDGKRHEPVQIPLRGLFDLLEVAASTTWPDVSISTGEGQFILERSMLIAKPDFAAQSCPARDNVKRKARVPSKLAPGELTFETAVGAELQHDLPNINLTQQAEDAAAAYEEYVAAEDTSEQRLFVFLALAYRLACSSRLHEEELFALAKERNLPCNRRTDLLGLSILLSLRGYEVDRRRRSNWAKALRYLYQERCRPADVVAKLKQYGGVRPCADRLTSKRKRRAPVTVKHSWTVLKEKGTGFVLGTSGSAEVPTMPGIWVVKGRKEGSDVVRVRHYITSSSRDYERLIGEIAASLDTNPKS